MFIFGGANKRYRILYLVIISEMPSFPFSGQSATTTFGVSRQLQILGVTFRYYYYYYYAYTTP